MRGVAVLRSDRMPDQAQAAVFERLEARMLLSSGGAGADTAFGAGITGEATPPHHHHFRHHFHQRHSYHHPHTVTPDVLLGHFVGTSPDGLEKNIDLTLARDATGKLNGLMLLDGFKFDSDFSATLYTDNTFLIDGFGVTKHGGLHGSVIHVGTHGTALNGNFGILYAGGGYSGHFSLTKT